MATPNDRKVIFSTYVIPKLQYTKTGNQETLEEGITGGQASYTAYKLDTAVNKTLGGKSSIAITEDQWSDGWVSFFHSHLDWEDHSTATDDQWENQDTCWDGTLSVPTSGDNTLSDESSACLFLYIKNLGDYELKVSLNGNDYDLLIPSGGSISLRPNGINCDDITVQSITDSTTIEYIIAK